ncbi:MAG TPA: hypothetical protein VHA52_11990 [Candidatus Babeliaceae bacterium]|nr:hypothetical protein [Candidatus Babeliaceae bacterium]
MLIYFQKLCSKLWYASSTRSKVILTLFMALTHNFFYSADKGAFTLLFDLSEVLFTTSRKGMFDELGWASTVWYIGFGGSQKALELATFKTLSLMGEQKGKDSDLVLSPDGYRLPLVMCEWLAGRKSGTSIIKAAHMYLDTAKERGCFSSNTEKELAGRVIEAIFDPEKLAKNTIAISGAEELLHACVAERDTHGNRKHRLLVHANWDPWSYRLLRKSQHGSKILKFFKNGDIVISGETGFLRPQAVAFEDLIKRYNLVVARCIVISAQIEMVQAAWAMGMRGIHVKNQDLNELRHELRKLEVLN